MAAASRGASSEPCATAMAPASAMAAAAAAPALPLPPRERIRFSKRKTAEREENRAREMSGRDSSDPVLPVGRTRLRLTGPRLGCPAHALGRAAR